MEFGSTAFNQTKITSINKLFYLTKTTILAKTATKVIIKFKILNFFFLNKSIITLIGATKSRNKPRIRKMR